MNQTESEFDPVEEVAEQLLERYRRGERPSLAQLTEQYPHLAGQIRELFPALVMMEQAGRAQPPGRQLPERLIPTSTELFLRDGRFDYALKAEIACEDRP